MASSNVRIAHLDLNTVLCGYFMFDLSNYEDDCDFIDEIVLESVYQSLEAISPSFNRLDTWLANGERIIADNKLVDVYFDYYDESAVVYIKPIGEDLCGLGAKFCENIKARFNMHFQEYWYRGSFNNGSPVFKRIK